MLCLKMISPAKRRNNVLLWRNYLFDVGSPYPYQISELETVDRTWLYFNCFFNCKLKYVTVLFFLILPGCRNAVGLERHEAVFRGGVHSMLRTPDERFHRRRSRSLILSHITLCSGIVLSNSVSENILTLLSFPVTDQFLYIFMCFWIDILFLLLLLESC